MGREIRGGWSVNKFRKLQISKLANPKSANFRTKFGIFADLPQMWQFADLWIQ